jgi:hypothetical protein
MMPCPTPATDVLLVVCIIADSPIRIETVQIRTAYELAKLLRNIPADIRQVPKRATRLKSYFFSNGLPNNPAIAVTTRDTFKIVARTQAAVDGAVQVQKERGLGARHPENLEVVLVDDAETLHQRQDGYLQDEIGVSGVGREATHVYQGGGEDDDPAVAPVRGCGTFSLVLLHDRAFLTFFYCKN